MSFPPEIHRWTTQENIRSMDLGVYFSLYTSLYLHRLPTPHRKAPVRTQTQDLLAVRAASSTAPITQHCRMGTATFLLFNVYTRYRSVFPLPLRINVAAEKPVVRVLSNVERRTAVTPSAVSWNDPSHPRTPHGLELAAFETESSLFIHFLGGKEAISPRLKGSDHADAINPNGLVPFFGQRSERSDSRVDLLETARWPFTFSFTGNEHSVRAGVLAPSILPKQSTQIIPIINKPTDTATANSNSFICVR